MRAHFKILIKRDGVKLNTCTKKLKAKHKYMIPNPYNIKYNMYKHLIFHNKKSLNKCVYECVYNEVMKSIFMCACDLIFG